MSASDLTSFRNAFKGDIITPSDPSYLQDIGRWARNAERRAKVVAFVKDTDDVVLAIEFARANQLPVAIRGGGHSASGASSAEGGLVIDLSRFINGARIDPEKKLAYIGGGAVWKTVDEAAIQHGLASVGGTVNHTGVGGLILGGGYGWLSGAHGLVIDNLQQATVVTADGRILTANAEENTDLFFGIRGGGCNFGVVTEFVLRLHPQRRTVFAGPVIFTPDKIPQLASLLDEWWAGVQEDKEAILAVMTRGPQNVPVIMLIVFYNGNESEGRRNFQKFYDLGPVVDRASEIPYEKLNSLQNEFVDHGFNYYLSGAPMSGKPSDDIDTGRFQHLMELSASGEFNTIVIVELWPHTKINGVAPEATPYRRDLHGNALILVRWAGGEAELLRKAREVVQEIKDTFNPGAGYGNYDMAEENPIALPGGKAPPSKVAELFRGHYPRMQAIKKKYDPEQVFNKWFAITPA